MLTIFSIPKPFCGLFATIQHNAITSWTELVPRCQVILCGNEKGVAEAAHQHGVEHVPEIDCNKYGTPLLSSAFALAQAQARFPIVCYTNADIIFMGDLLAAVLRIEMPAFLMVGRRMDANISKPLNIGSSGWENDLREQVRLLGVLHASTGIDYFVFPRGQVELLPFAVGRILWDNWMIFQARYHKTPVIDATDYVLAIHQNHDYSHLSEGVQTSRDGPEVKENWQMVGPNFVPFTIQDADWILNGRGLQRNSGLAYTWRRLLTCPAFVPSLRPLIGLMRRLKRDFPFVHNNRFP